MTLNTPFGFEPQTPPDLGVDGARPANGIRGEIALRVALRHGGQADASIRYELIGREGAPLLVVAGGISAGRHVVSSEDFPEAGWWEAQRSTLDLCSYRILSFDWLGADGLLDLPIDPSDQAAVAARLVAELGLGQAAGFVGASYGGMVGMHLAADHPGAIRALLAISAPPHSHPYSSACRALQRRAISLGEQGGDAAAGVALARALAMLTYRTPEEFADRFADQASVEDQRVRVAAEDYLDAQGDRHCRRISAAAYRRLSESIDLHCIDPAAITVPLTLAAVDADALVPTGDIEALANAVPGCRLHRIASRYGHDAFLKEDAQVAAIITDFVNSLEQHS